MTKKIQKLILGCFLGLYATISPSFALKFEEYVEGQPRLKSVTTELINNTTSYKLWLKNNAIDLADRTANRELDPVGSGWIYPQNTIKNKNTFLISYQSGYIHYRSAQSTDDSWPKTKWDARHTNNPEDYDDYVSFTLDEGTQQKGPFLIEIKKEPVPIFIWGAHIKTPDEDKEWTAIMHNLSIHVIELPEKDL